MVFRLLDSTAIAKALGILVGVGSFFLYSPIAIRLLRQKHVAAEGLVLSTWWLKLSSYTASDIYYVTQGYSLSTYIESVILALEAALILCLVAYYQGLANGMFWCQVTLFLTGSIFMLLLAPIQLIELGQGVSAILNTGALLPQFYLNHKRRKAGDYSPITALLAAIGCAARVFTTFQLNNADALLVATFGTALVVNGSLLAQMCFLGSKYENRTIWEILTADARRSTEIELNEEIDHGDDTPYRREEENISLVDIHENSPLTVRRQNDIRL